MSKLIVLGHQVAIAAFGAAHVDGKLVGARQFIAGKFGITLPKVAKGEKGKTMKEVKAMILAKSGNTEEQIKVASKEYDAARSSFYQQSALVNGQLAADPTLRKSVRLSISKKTGDVIGATTTYRREKGANASMAVQLAELREALAVAHAKLALAAPAVA